MSVREASRVFGLHRDTVRKMLSNPVPPGYRRQRPPHRPKLEPYTGVIDSILQTDLSLPKKQRHTAKRIFERLRDEHGFEGGYTIVKDYVRERRRHTREMFVPLAHPAGQAWAVIEGGRRRVHYFVLSLPHSDGIFVKAYPRRDDRGVLRQPRVCVRLPGRSSAEHPVRQHEACGGEDTGRWSSQSHEDVH